MLDFRTEKRDTGSVLYLTGRLVEEAITDYADRLQDVIDDDGERRLCVDLNKVTEIDQAGVDALVGSHCHALRQDRYLQVAGLNGQPDEFVGGPEESPAGEYREKLGPIECFATVDDALFRVYGVGEARKATQ